MPVAVAPPAQTAAVALSGTVRATNGTQPLAGATVSVGQASATTDGAGRYSLSVAPWAAMTLAVSGAGLVQRRVSAAISDIDAIVEGSGFDLGFYRQFARNGFESPTRLQPIKRLERAPLIYLKTVDQSGAPIDAAQLDSASATIIDAAPQWAGGRFGIAGIERGTGTKEGVSGYITIRWINSTERICGQSNVGTDGGYIDLAYRSPYPCGCGSLHVRPYVVRHELGHAFGFWHTDSPSDVMGPVFAGCDQPLSPRERYHAVIAYSRPVGNTDPDTDPAP